MPPQSSRYPAPAAGGAAPGGGRHRRPESLADVTSAPRPQVPVPPRSRHSRATGPGRHAKQSPAAHRAPGTPLLKGKKRQQILLASLVAIGLLLVAIPAEHRRSGVEAVNAAAQRAVGSGSPAKKHEAAKAAAVAKDRPARPEPEKPAPSTSASATAPATVAPTVPPKPVVNDLGPGHSMRTTGSKAIALTFDDGPDPVQTPRILALLAKYQVKATFCLVGAQVEKHPEVVRQIVAAGHTLCNHTSNHSLTVGKETPEKIVADLEETNAAIHAAVPDAKIPFFRAPGGNFTERLVGVADQLGMQSLYWAVDPRDWDHIKGETDPAHVNRVIANVQKHVKPGSIILSHDFNQPDTIEAYDKLIPWLKDHYTIGIPGATIPVSPDPSPSVSAQP